jgi:hypothetical protein
MNDNLRKAAFSTLSHYEGGEQNDYDGVESYEGAGFDGNGVENFGGSSKAFVAKKQFTLKISNIGASAVDKIVAILPGYFGTAAQIKTKNGVPCDAIIADGAFITGTGITVSASGAPGSVADFQGYMSKSGHAARLLGMIVKADDPAQLDSDIYIKHNTPFNETDDVIETPSNWKRSEEPNEKIAQLDFSEADVLISNVSTIVTTIQAGRTLTVVFNIAETFKAKNMVKKSVAASKKHKKRFI